MFNSAQVNRWLQDNVKFPIFHHYLLISTKSDLLAYPRPSDIKQYRNEAALVLKAWQDADCKLLEQYSNARQVPSHRTGKIDVGAHEMWALTIETAAGNVLARAVQPCLLLVLVGCKAAVYAASDDAASAVSTREKVTTEAKGDQSYPARSDAPPAVIDFSTLLFSDESGATGSISPKTPITSTRASSTYRSKPHSLSNSQREDSLLPQTRQQNEGEQDTPTAAAIATPAASGTNAGQAAAYDAQQQYGEIERQHDDLLYLQREKLDAMADWLAARLKDKEFRIKEDNS